MQKFSLIIILLLSLATASQAQYELYLPMILKDAPKNSWQIIYPIQTTNMVTNPSGETTGNFAAVGAATITRSTTYQKYGLYSYRVQSVGNGTGLSLTLSTLTNANHWMTARIRGALPKELRFSIGAGSKKAVLLEKIDDNWNLYGAVFNAAQSNGATAARLTQFGTGNGDFYVDGVQVEAQSDWTTYCDGTQEGCGWNGTEHASTSTRSGQSLAGGIPQDLYQEYSFFVQRVVGAGSATQQLNVDSYALLPGGELNSVKIQSRQFTLVGKFITDSEMELHDERQDLIEVLKLASPGQPLRLRFNNARVQKEISVFYQGGLEGDLAAFYENFEAVEDNQWMEVQTFTEKAAIQFSAPDPFWYEVGESAAVLDTNDEATFRIVAGRLRSTGQWDDLGPPNVAGTYTDIRAIAEDATYVYFGGSFLNFDNIANADYIVRYNKSTGAYSAMGTGGNDIVEALAVGSDGSVYAAGRFTSMGGVANTNRIARWDSSAGTWNALSTGANGNIFALAISLSGLLYVGGEFTTIGGVAANRVASWDSAVFSALSTGLNGGCFALAIGIDGTIYMGGAFTTAGGSAANYVVSWNPTSLSFSTLGSGMDTDVEALAVGPNGLLYAGGDFVTAGGVSARPAVWNGSSWAGLGAIADNTVEALSVGSDNILYAGGSFLVVGGLTLADRVGRWNGYSWAHLDIDLPGSPAVFAIHASKYVDPVVEQKYDLFLSFNTTGTGNFAGLTSDIENAGSVPAFPKIIYTRDGGTTAIIETLRNERDGKELLFNYSLLDDERLTIDLAPTKKSIVSNFFGSRLDAILPNSDFGSFALQPGETDITSFVATTGAPTIVGYLLWRDTFDSWD